MDKAASLALFAYLYVSSLYFTCSYCSPRPPIGVHPSDEKYYDAELIGCKDGLKSFTRDRLNDNFCDCADGTDEPGTSACPYGKFYCRNTGSIPRFLFSSRVNDHICDCCDGSDEYNGAVICPNICVMGGNVQTIRYDSVASNVDSVNSRKSKPGGNKIENSSQSPGGWEVLMFLQIGVVIFVVIFQIRRRKSRRRTNLFDIEGLNTLTPESHLLSGDDG